jgi:hypothetical protein
MGGFYRYFRLYLKILMDFMEPNEVLYPEKVLLELDKGEYTPMI